MNKILLILLCSVSLSASAQWTLKDFNALYALTGGWKLNNKKGVLHENWVKVSDSTLNGFSYLITTTDSLPEETVELWFMNGKITYTPTTVSQNEGNPVVFTLVNIKAGKYIFENKEHDFPTQITYQLVDNKTLHAAINGTINGQFKEIQYHYTRDY
ncbi:MAG: DUF4388 domain-containing protein [Chitinophagaceae bacterium]|nr:MAG: DUF4388 domain-containing protein [Chitinophagaceae bacterium]